MKSNHHPQGVDNALLDLGFDDAEELSAKAALVLKLNQLIDRRGLSQTATAAITGMTQPKVWCLKCAATSSRTFRWISMCGSFVVQPARRSRLAGIAVAA